MIFNMASALFLPINRLLGHQVDRPEREQRYNRLDRYIGIEHLSHGRRADDARESDERKEHAIDGNGDGIGDEDQKLIESKRCSALQIPPAINSTWKFSSQYH